jgi:hypothetical protein
MEQGGQVVDYHYTKGDNMSVRMKLGDMVHNYASVTKEHLQNIMNKTGQQFQEPGR